ncbi:MAG: EAL domain-containing protein (putative c-di-GMP-specific phosphodiesterase class I) [Colwellia sp.]|jgi:EAL domain-containing protein (putative c-di-GMP-specific phosphodiesterase class I)/FixJ family two-component response regulator
MTNKKLFVIDDEYDFAAFVADVAEDLGFEVKATSNPTDFINNYIDFDIIVLDLFMPVVDGIEILRFLVDNNSQAAIIFMSGKDKNVLHSAQKLAFEQGMVVLGVLQKPFIALELEEILSKYIPPISTTSQLTDSVELPTIEDLQEAIENKELFLAYQPQINLVDRKVVGVEALVRWEHPLKGMIPPSYFIPMAEEYNLISSITEYVTKTAIRQAGEWQVKGINLCMSINISPQTLDDLDMPEKLTAYAQEMGVATSDIVIEVTETALMSDIVRYMDILTRLRMKGFNLSIDDFGTGYSSLQKLVQVPFTELKIDLSFIQKLMTDKDCKTITEISILLAHRLDMQVVAEGIENEATWDILKEMGCDVGQGYWMGMPMSADKIPAWIKSWYSR